MKHIYIITGGTLVHVTPHFALCAPAYGQVGTDIFDRISAALHDKDLQETHQPFLIKTRMAGQNSEETDAHLSSLGFDLHEAIETNDDLEGFVRVLVGREETAVIIMAAAICDFVPEELTGFEGDTAVTISEFGKDKKRLHQAHSLNLKLRPSNKIIDLIKTSRPDIMLVTFKTTAGATEAELVAKASLNLQRSNSDFVFGNDIHSKINVVVLPNKQLIRGQDRQDTLDRFCLELIHKLLST